MPGAAVSAGRRGSAVVEAGHGAALDRGAQNTGDGPDDMGVLAGRQGIGVTRAFRPTGAADAVDVGVGGVGNVVVDDMGYAGDVDAPGGDVGGHQDLEFAGAKAVERGLSPSLGKVPLNGRRTVSGTEQFISQLFGAVLGAGEDQDGTGVGIVQDRHQQRCFQVLGHRVKGVAHGVRRCGGADLNGLGPVQDLAGQRADLARHGRRKEERLPLFGKLLQDTADVGQKSHVEHVIRLVQHQNLEVRKGNGSPVDMVQQAAGTGDDDIDATAELLDLGVDIDAAVEGDARKACFSSKHLKGLVNLFRQFACGGKDQGAGTVVMIAPGPLPAVFCGFFRRIARDQAVQYGKGKGGGFAGAGLGKTHKIAARHHFRDGLGLNRGRPGVACGRDARRDGRMQIECLKCHKFLCVVQVGVKV